MNMTKLENIDLLGNIAALAFQPFIRVKAFERDYPDWPNSPQEQGALDEIISLLLSWYLSSVSGLKDKGDQLTEQLKEKDNQLRKKDEQATELRKEKDKQIEILTGRLNDLIVRAKKLEDETSDLIDVAKQGRSPTHKWGSVTRSESWDALVNERQVNDLPAFQLSNEMSGKKQDLASQFGEIDLGQWQEETDMYPDIIEAVQDTFYSGESGVFVVDTHSKGDFRPDISVGDYKDERLLYCLWYFIELKLPDAKLLMSAHCGQILDYFHKIHEKQPHRRDFVAVLPNFVSAWVFFARFEADTVKISKQPAPSLADAIAHADMESRRQYTMRIPPLDKRFASNYTILAIAKHHFLLRVPLPARESAGPVAPVLRQTRSTNPKNPSTKDQSWQPPSRHGGATHFALKIVHGRTTVANEITILKKIRDAECVHLPELVWMPEGNGQLGIVPVGRPIDFRQTAHVSRKIVHGLIDGLKYLHAQNIVHRDIRPSNLVLDSKNNIVIIDYETAVATVHAKSTSIEYVGGFICWPKRLLGSNITRYKPKPADDLFACILVVLHLVFPSWFDTFRASGIMVSDIGQRTKETERLLALWKEIGQSKIWGSFMKAAESEDYELLMGMADVFCHI